MPLPVPLNRPTSLDLSTLNLLELGSINFQQAAIVSYSSSLLLPPDLTTKSLLSTPANPSVRQYIRSPPLFTKVPSKFHERFLFYYSLIHKSNPLAQLSLMDFSDRPMLLGAYSEMRMLDVRVQTKIQT